MCSSALLLPGAHARQPPAPGAAEGHHPGAGSPGPATEPDPVTAAADARADHREPRTQPQGTLDTHAHARAHTHHLNIAGTLQWLVYVPTQMSGWA